MFRTHDVRVPVAALRGTGAGGRVGWHRRLHEGLGTAIAREPLVRSRAGLVVIGGMADVRDDVML